MPVEGASGAFFCEKKMINAILASKGKMGAAFVKGRRFAVTKVLAGPCVVIQVKKMEKDGYWAVQLGFGERRIKNISKAMQGHLKLSQNSKVKTQSSNLKSQNTLPRFIREVRLEEEPKMNVGDEVKASDVFNVGDIVSVYGISKGKGFQGVVKRWGFAGGPRTHGQSDRERAPGSIGQGTTPGRVYKGKHMAGRMGGDSVTVKNLQVVSIEPETGLIEISGPVPGDTGGLLKITRTAKGELEGIQEVAAQVVEGEPSSAEATEDKVPADAGLPAGKAGAVAGRPADEAPTESGAPAATKEVPAAKGGQSDKS